MEAVAIKEALIILDQIPFALDVDNYLKKLRLGSRVKYIERARALAFEAQEIGRPKAFSRPAYIEKKGDGTIVVEGITFNSSLFNLNLQDVFRVFPFVATCGTELEDWSKTKTSILEQLWADMLKQEALRVAINALVAYLSNNFGLKKVGQMNPGSLPAWPLTEQIPLFHLLNKSEEAIGVVLTEGLAMYPVKSVSGFLFPSATEFKNCQLCQREGCPGRKIPYAADLLK
ncbi:MAG: vitamin B12 dependent-methionine synthase activation domain-containing protein [Bacillota bacterium]